MRRHSKLGSAKDPATRRNLCLALFLIAQPGESGPFATFVRNDILLSGCDEMASAAHHCSVEVYKI